MTARSGRPVNGAIWDSLATDRVLADRGREQHGDVGPAAARAAADDVIDRARDRAAGGEEARRELRAHDVAPRVEDAADRAMETGTVRTPPDGASRCCATTCRGKRCRAALRASSCRWTSTKCGCRTRSSSITVQAGTRGVDRTLPGRQVRQPASDFRAAQQAAEAERRERRRGPSRARERGSRRAGRLRPVRPPRRRPATALPSKPGGRRRGPG